MLRLVQSKELKEFYSNYLLWIHQGAYVEHPAFRRDWGLCSNAMQYGRVILQMDRPAALMHEIQNQFKQLGYSPEYPFGGKEHYQNQRNSKTMHLDLNRIQWVEEHAHAP